jgi:hypothetical protein
MNINDFYSGYGVAVNGAGDVVNANFILPSIGMKYIQYHNLSLLIGTFWEDVVLNDISSAKTTAQSPGDFDVSGWDLDKMVEVQYTWSNNGKKGIIVPDDASSLKFEIDTTTQLSTTDLIIDVVGGIMPDPEDPFTAGGSVKGDPHLASHLYFMEKNPTIYKWVTDAGVPLNLGPYVDATIGQQRYHRTENEAPAHEVYGTQTILTVTGYSKNNYMYDYSKNLNKINNTDFLASPYDKRELRLAAQGKLPTYDATDLATLDDSYMWLFYDFTKTEHSIDIYKYELFFLFKPTAWTTYFDVIVTEYEEVEFQSLLIDPLTGGA